MASSKPAREKFAKKLKLQRDASVKNKGQRKEIESEVKQLLLARAGVQHGWDQLRQDSVLFTSDDLFSKQSNYMRQIEEIETKRERLADRMENSKRRKTLDVTGEKEV